MAESHWRIITPGDPSTLPTKADADQFGWVLWRTECGGVFPMHWQTQPKMFQIQRPVAWMPIPPYVPPKPVKPTWSFLCGVWRVSGSDRFSITVCQKGLFNCVDHAIPLGAENHDTIAEAKAWCEARLRGERETPAEPEPPEPVKPTRRRWQAEPQSHFGPGGPVEVLTISGSLRKRDTACEVVEVLPGDVDPDAAIRMREVAADVADKFDALAAVLRRMNGWEETATAINRLIVALRGEP